MTMEAWAERWLELSIMPVFSSRSADLPDSNPGASKGLGGKLSVHRFLSSPKVVVFNQVRLVMWMDRYGQSIDMAQSVITIFPPKRSHLLPDCSLSSSGTAGPALRQ